MITEGMFDHNGSIIDPRISKNRVRSVCTHEFTHNYLTSSTTFGLLLLMLGKNSLFFDRAKVVHDELFTHVYRMQERVAINIELLSKYITEGEATYHSEVELLRERNRTYYNYFRKLCCVNGKIKSTSDAENAIFSILAIATTAMNIDLDQIPFEQFNTPIDIQRFFSTNDNVRMFNPNRRFDDILNNMYRSHTARADMTLMDSASIPAKEFDNRLFLHSKAEKAAKKIFETSSIKNRLISRAKTIGSGEVSFPNQNTAELLTIYPLEIDDSMRIPKHKVLNPDAFLQKFVECDCKEIIINHQLGGFEDMYICYFFDDSVNATFYFVNFSDEFHLLNALQKLDCKVIFLHSKLILKLHKSLKKVIRQLPIYIYYDIPVYNGLTERDFLKVFYTGGKYYFQEMNGYTLLVLYKKSFYSIFNVVNDAKGFLEPILTAHNMKLSEDPIFSEQTKQINDRMRLITSIGAAMSINKR